MKALDLQELHEEYWAGCQHHFIKYKTTDVVEFTKFISRNLFMRIPAMLYYVGVILGRFNLNEYLVVLSVVVLEGKISELPHHGMAE